MRLRRVLHVTSPMMHGTDVIHAQKMLKSTAGGTPHGNYHPGAVDGQYGPHCAAAAKRAKFWLGYDHARINGHYGQELEDHLSGALPLSAEYRRRRKSRLAKAQEVPLRERAFKKAFSQLGIKEAPANSNRVKFSAWYGMTGPWCAMFVTWCYVQAGARASFQKGEHYAYVPYMIDAARGHDHHMIRLERGEVKHGDIVTYDWEGGGMRGSSAASDHTGLFDRWINEVAGTFLAIEGNTSFGSNSNGGQVMTRERNMGEVSCFIRAEV
jgi:hypothetical protein